MLLLCPIKLEKGRNSLADKAHIKWLSQNKYGIFGTVLFHMFLLVIILFIKVNTVQKNNDELIYVDLKVLEEIKKIQTVKQEAEARPKPTGRQARNIAVNRSEDKVEKYNDYKTPQPSKRTIDREVQGRVNQAVKDIIRENHLNPEDKELPKVDSKPIDFYQPKKIEEEQIYKGPTNIYFKLDERKVAYLPIPVYKCKGGATVQVDVRVGQRGKVELATINKGGTDTSDPCFLDAAKEAASRTRFNFSTTAALLQQGYIIYHFVAQ